MQNKIFEFEILFFFVYIKLNYIYFVFIFYPMVICYFFKILLNFDVNCD